MQGTTDKVRGGVGGEHGQASVELIAAIPGLVLASLIAFQLIATGYTVTLADGAAEAGAMARASGLRAEPAVRSALPGWARDRVGVRQSGGRVEVVVRPPSPLGAVAERLKVTSVAAVAESGL